MGNFAFSTDTAPAGKPWRLVSELTYRPRCRGSLPPDTEAACQECGTGTPAAPPVTIRMVQGTFTPTGPLTPPPGYTVLDEEHTFTREELAEGIRHIRDRLDGELHPEALRAELAALAAEPPAPPAHPWWQRFARWPNV